MWIFRENTSSKHPKNVFQHVRQLDTCRQANESNRFSLSTTMELNWRGLLVWSKSSGLSDQDNQIGFCYRIVALSYLRRNCPHVREKYGIRICLKFLHCGNRIPVWFRILISVHHVPAAQVRCLRFILPTDHSLDLLLSEDKCLRGLRLMLWSWRAPSKIRGGAFV